MMRIGYAPGLRSFPHRPSQPTPGSQAPLRFPDRRSRFGRYSHGAQRHHPVVPLAERLEIVRSVRFVDAVHAATTNDKIEIWQDLRFDVLFKGDDWRGTEKGDRLERDFAAVGVDVVYFRYTSSTSSTELRRALQSIDAIADSLVPDTQAFRVPRRDVPAAAMRACA